MAPARCAAVALALLRPVAAKPNKYYMDPILKGGHSHSFVLHSTLQTLYDLTSASQLCCCCFSVLFFFFCSFLEFFLLLFSSSSIFIFPLFLLSVFVSTLTSLLATFIYSLQQCGSIFLYIYFTHGVIKSLSIQFHVAEDKKPMEKKTI